MPKLALEVPHTLGKEEATRRLKERFDFARGSIESYVSDLQQEWKDNTLTYGFRVMGMKIAGTLVVEDQVVKLNSDLPLAAIMMKGMIEQRTRDELSRALR